MSEKPSLVRAYLRRIKDIFWEWQGIKSAGDAVNTHASTEKKAKVLVSMSIIAIFTCLVTLQLKGCHDESEIRRSEDNARNYQSQLSQADRNLTEKNGQILKQQSDFNEAKREKDNDISNLKTENDNLKNQLTLWQTMPVNVAALYSNLQNIYIESTDPTNRQQIGLLLAQINSLTNLFADELSGKPKMSVYVNGTKISDSTTIQIESGEEIKIRIINSGKAQAGACQLDFDIPKAFTNWIHCPWQVDRRPVLQETSIGRVIELNDREVYLVQKDGIMAGTFDDMQPISVSTNAPDFVCPCGITISEKFTGYHQFQVVFFVKHHAP